MTNDHEFGPSDFFPPSPTSEAPELDFGTTIRSLCFSYDDSDKLWVDDVRGPPDNDWQVVRSAPEAVVAILDRLAQVAVGKAKKMWGQVSLDHDLGPPHLGTGADVMHMILRHQDLIRRNGLLIAITCHSANPVGRARIQADIDLYYKMWRAADEEDRHL